MVPNCSSSNLPISQNQTWQLLTYFSTTHDAQWCLPVSQGPFSRLSMSLYIKNIQVPSKDVSDFVFHVMFKFSDLMSKPRIRRRDHIARSHVQQIGGLIQTNKIKIQIGRRKVCQYNAPNPGQELRNGSQKDTHVIPMSERT